MAFGQQSGPPANAKQIRELLELLEAAGHTDFRDARGPMGFTQRQAGGKFTRDEADAFIEQLQAEAADTIVDGEHDSAPPESPTAAAQRPVRLTATDMALRKFSDEVLAAEMQRRGWIVVEP